MGIIEKIAVVRLDSEYIATLCSWYSAVSNTHTEDFIQTEDFFQTDDFLQTDDQTYYQTDYLEITDDKTDDSNQTDDQTDD